MTSDQTTAHASMPAHTLRFLLEGLPIGIGAAIAAHDVDPLDVAVSSIAYDSRRVVPGALFVCVRGFEADGHRFATQAAERGAVALIVDHELEVDLPQVTVADTKVALAAIADRFYGHPSDHLSLVGITGTNGKTTTTYILDSIMREAGMTTGVIGTVETRIADRRIVAERTTPESADVQALLADMVAAGVSGVAMEVSSHAIDLHRVDGLRFGAIAFTNLTQDHLDYHHTLDAYFAVKRRLFTDFPTAARVIDIDTEHGQQLAADVVAHAASHDHGAAPLLRVGRSPMADVSAQDEVPTADSTSFTLVTPAGTRGVTLPLAGAYNVSNALLAAGCALAIGIDLDTVVAGLQVAPQVPGRLEQVRCGQPFTVVVDYAHTPDSLDKALRAMREVTDNTLISVFGCGGDRDPAKRAVMGEVSGTLADYTIVTSDNPRSEDPVGIVLQVEDGVTRAGGAHEVEVDRRSAIARAISIARPGDCVLIAGKGHETYQIFADHTAHFDDREEARNALASLGYQDGTQAC